MIKNKSKKVWVCDCGRKVVAKKCRLSVPRVDARIHLQVPLKL